MFSEKQGSGVGAKGRHSESKEQAVFAGMASTSHIWDPNENIKHRKRWLLISTSHTARQETKTTSCEN